MRKRETKNNEMLINPKHTNSVGLTGLPSQEDVNLLFDPVFVIGGVCVGGLLVDQTREVGQLKCCK